MPGVAMMSRLLKHVGFFLQITGLFYRALLRKRPVFSGSLLIVATHKHGTTIGWRRPIGWLNLQVIFRKRATSYRVLLRKMS